MRRRRESENKGEKGLGGGRIFRFHIQRGRVRGGGSLPKLKLPNLVHCWTICADVVTEMDRKGDMEIKIRIQYPHPKKPDPAKPSNNNLNQIPNGTGPKFTSPHHLQ